MFCLPVPHDRFVTRTPLVLIAIAILDAILLVPSLGSGSTEWIARYGFTPASTSLLTFFSGMFLHAGLWHYIGNMWFFYIFGRKIEATLGHWRFLALFLIAGIGGQLVYWALNLHSPVPCVGASGAISGIAGAYLVLYPLDRFDLILYLGWIRLKKIESNAKVAVGAWMGEQVLLGLLTMLRPFSTVAFWAHVGGFASGVAIAWLFCRRVAETERPVFERIERPLESELGQPDPLVGLHLSATPARLTPTTAAQEPEIGT